MLETATILLVLVGAMHSTLGGRRLITPLIARDDFPTILGSQRNARLTLWFGWHALTLFWWAQAFVFWRMAKESAQAGPATLTAWAAACGLLGVAALVLTHGRHLSWVFFWDLYT